MPRYFFDICDGKERIVDEEGTECADLEAAMAEAHASARDLIRQFVSAEWSLARRYIEVRDDSGSVMARVPVLTVFGKPH